MHSPPSRGLLLYTEIMTPPVDQPIRAVVGFCHGYTDHPSYTKRRELAYLVQHGIAVIMIECEGHGRSDGPLGLVPDWDVLCADVHEYFGEVMATTDRFLTNKFFLMGEVSRRKYLFCFVFGLSCCIVLAIVLVYNMRL
jgi:alpha-beta hydrolase superfamily lysophospholipase